MGIESQEKTFGKYTLLQRIATGGMAEVFRVRTSGVGGFEKTLAIKRLHTQLSQDKNFIQMLVDEAKITVLLQHPGIVQILDFGEIDGQYFIAMEFVDGPDLYQVLHALHQTGRQLSTQAVCFIISEICHGLHYAHCQIDPAGGTPLGIIHRDVSPQNILLSWAGAVKIADFGKFQTELIKY